MSKPIVQKGAEVLATTAQEVPQALFGTKELASILADMEAALENAPHGVAIAAPQIGIPYRIFLVRYDRMGLTRAERLDENTAMTPEIGVYINPKLIRHSRKRISMNEGCLSVDGIYGTTTRFERATAEAYDAEGKKFTRGAGGILAQAFQHEIDHLNGILFVDHATNLHTITEDTEYES